MDKGAQGCHVSSYRESREQRVRSKTRVTVPFGNPSTLIGYQVLHTGSSGTARYEYVVVEAK